jgi:hypothetical protein
MMTFALGIQSKLAVITALTGFLDQSRAADASDQ